MRVDLHCHSTASDGMLSPSELLHSAWAAGVDLLSITDHDTLAAYAGGLTPPSDLRLVPGIEFSSQWRGTGIHIVGLNVDPRSEVLADGVARQRERRMERAGRIAERLKRVRLPDVLPRVLELTHGAAPGRPHFARCLVEIGAVKDPNQAFRKYLGAGKPAYVSPRWAPPEEIVGWIRAAGGIAIMAHPGKYRLTRTRLRALLDDFRAAGGHGLEVVCGYQSEALTRDLAGLCAATDLLASCGSDFHETAPGRAPLGGACTLPAGCRPVWENW